MFSEYLRGQVGTSRSPHQGQGHRSKKCVCVYVMFSDGVPLIERHSSCCCSFVVVASLLPLILLIFFIFILIFLIPYHHDYSVSRFLPNEREQPGQVEDNHWPQRPTWVMSSRREILTGTSGIAWTAGGCNAVRTTPKRRVLAALDWLVYTRHNNHTHLNSVSKFKFIASWTSR